VTGLWELLGDAKAPNYQFLSGLVSMRRTVIFTMNS